MSTDRRAVSGIDHPLARMADQLVITAERSVAVSAVLVIGVLAHVHELPAGAPVSVAAATVLAVLLVRVGMLVEARNRRAVELIAQGRGELPVRVVARARRRLLDPVHRERLARTLDVMRAEVERPPEMCHPIRPLYSVRVVRAVSQELDEVARLVRDDGELRGLASAEQMVTDGRSPLYGDGETVLRQELGRIRYLLASHDRRPRDGVT